MTSEVLCTGGGFGDNHTCAHRKMDEHGRKIRIRHCKIHASNRVARALTRKHGKSLAVALAAKPCGHKDGESECFPEGAWGSNDLAVEPIGEEEHGNHTQMRK